MLYQLSYSRMLVGAAGFEPATSCPQSRRAAGLRYAPIKAEAGAASMFSLARGLGPVKKAAGMFLTP